MSPRSPVERATAERATAEATAERTLQAYGILVSVCGWDGGCGMGVGSQMLIDPPGLFRFEFPECPSPHGNGSVGMVEYGKVRSGWDGRGWG